MIKTVAQMILFRLLRKGTYFTEKHKTLFICGYLGKIPYFCLPISGFYDGGYADVAKLADAPDLGSGAVRRVGSTPIIRTFSEG
jgi:hypothetical protein